MRLKLLIKSDFKLQVKYGIILALFVMTAVWIGMLWFFPTSTMNFVIPIAFITDFAVTGFMLFAAMIFFEKGQGTIHAVVTTPVKVSEYIKSKVITLGTTISAVGVVLTIFVSLQKGLSANYFMAIISSILSVMFFILMSCIISIRFKSFTDMILPMGGVFTVLFIPLLNYVNSSSLDFLDYFIFIFPTNSMVRIIDTIFYGGNYITIIHVFYILIWNYVLYKYAIKVFNQKLIGRECDIDV